VVERVVAHEGAAVISPVHQQQGCLPGPDLEDVTPRLLKELGVPLVYPPVGGHLMSFALQCESIAPGDLVLAWVSRGYRIEFTSTQPSNTVPRETLLPSSPEGRQVLLAEVEALLKKQAIVPVFPPFREALMVNLFSGTKEDRRLEAHPQSQAAECEYKAAGWRL
jgi:hypothetical protein